MGAPSADCGAGGGAAAAGGPAHGRPLPVGHGAVPYRQPGPYVGVDANPPRPACAPRRAVRGAEPGLHLRGEKRETCGDVILPYYHTCHRITILSGGNMV
eukprot:6116209-Pyramimonas_sp.AAC.1